VVFEYRWSQGHVPLYAWVGSVVGAGEQSRGGGGEQLGG
jgi:hypothetical protein